MAPPGSSQWSSAGSVSPAIVTVPPHVPAARATLPTWAAILIGALIVLLIGATVLLANQWMGSEPPAVIVVQTTPQKADLFLNGELIANRTPFTLDNLPAATYVLTVRAERYEEAVRGVRLQPGDHRLVTIDLVRQQGTASLIVRTNPEGLHVWVNGRDTELVTPATVLGLYAGDQTIVLKREDGSMVHRFRMPIGDGAAEVVEIDTRRLPALLDVTSEPPGAQVMIGGRQQGTTPTTIADLRPGRVRVDLAKAGCQPVTRKVRLRPATVMPMQVQLNCETSAKATFTATLVSDIYVDGQRVGRTPFFNLALPTGKHRLRLVPVSGGVKPFEGEFMLVAGDPPKTVHHRF